MGEDTSQSKLSVVIEPLCLVEHYGADVLPRNGMSEFISTLVNESHAVGLWTSGSLATVRKLLALLDSRSMGALSACWTKQWCSSADDGTPVHKLQSLHRIVGDFDPCCTVLLTSTELAYVQPQENLLPMRPYVQASSAEADPNGSMDTTLQQILSTIRSLHRCVPKPHI